MSTFCLVHGASLGTWCWERLIPKLEAQGHQTITMNLPINNPSASLSDYTDVVVQSLQKVDDDIILVGHSMAGMIIPLVATQRPVRKLIFLGALIPQIGMSGFDQFYDEVDPNMLEKIGYKPPAASLFEQLQDEPDIFKTTSLMRQEALQDKTLVMECCFHDCEQDVAEWAFSNLQDQRSPCCLTEVTPLQTFPEAEYAYIVCTDDRIISPTWSKYAARKRLGVEAIEVSGGHYPHIANPVEFAEILTKSI